MTVKQGTIWKLIDKKGFLGCGSVTEALIKACVNEDDILTREYVINEGHNRIDLREGNYIYFSELEAFFEVVQEAKQQDLWPWDGIEDLEVGMTVKHKGHNFPVKYISDDGEEVVLDMDCPGLQVVDKCYILPAVKSPKEQTFDKVLSSWKRQGLDFGYYNKDSSVNMGAFFDMVWDIMNEGGEG